MDNIRDKRPLTTLSSNEQAAVDFARALLRSRKVSRPVFDRATASFGRRGTLTLANLIASHALLAHNMNAYEPEARRTRRSRPWRYDEWNR